MKATASLCIVFAVVIAVIGVALFWPKKKLVYESASSANCQLVEVELNGRKLSNFKEKPLQLPVGTENRIAFKVLRNEAIALPRSVNFEIIQVQQPDIVCVQGGHLDKVVNDKAYSVISGKFNIKSDNVIDGPLIFVLKSMKDVLIELPCIVSKDNAVQR